MAKDLFSPSSSSFPFSSPPPSSFTTSSLPHSPSLPPPLVFLSPPLLPPPLLLLSQLHLWRTMAREPSPSQAALSMNHTAPLPASDEQSTNLEKSNLTNAGKFPFNPKGKCWSCKGTPGAGDRMDVGGRTGVSLDLLSSGKGDSGVGDTWRCQGVSGDCSSWVLNWHCGPSLGSQGAADCLDPHQPP